MNMPKQCGHLAEPPEDSNLKQLYCVRIKNHDGEYHRNNTGEYEWDDEGRIMKPGKIIPLRCNVCGNLVGTVRALEPTNPDTQLVQGEMKLEGHSPDCPVLAAFLNENMRFYSISVGSYKGPSLEDKEEVKESHPYTIIRKQEE